MVDTRRVRIVVARAVFFAGFVITFVAMIITANSAGADRTGVVLAVIAVVLVLVALPFCGFKPPGPRSSKSPRGERPCR